MTADQIGAHIIEQLKETIIGLEMAENGDVTFEVEANAQTQIGMLAVDLVTNHYIPPEYEPETGGLFDHIDDL